MKELKLCTIEKLFLLACVGIVMLLFVFTWNTMVLGCLIVGSYICIRRFQILDKI